MRIDRRTIERSELANDELPRTSALRAWTGKYLWRSEANSWGPFGDRLLLKPSSKIGIAARCLRRIEHSEVVTHGGLWLVTMPYDNHLRWQQSMSATGRKQTL